MATAPIPLTPSPYIEFIRSLEALPPGTPDAKRLDYMAWTMLGEAANQGDDGMAAIGNVVLNRAGSGSYPSDILDVMLQNKQFSTWNKGLGGNDPKGTYPKSDPRFQNARRIAADVVSGRRPDITGGATHYWSPKGMKAMGYAETPYWAEGEKSKWGTLELGDHVFLPKKPVPPGDIPAGKSKSPAPQPLEKPKSVRLAQAMSDVLRLPPLPSPAPLDPRNPLGRSGDGLTARVVKTVAIDPMTGMPPSRPSVTPIPTLPKPPVQGLTKVVPGRDLREQSWGVGGANQAGTNRMAVARPSIVAGMYDQMGVPDPLGPIKLDRFNGAALDEELEFDALTRAFTRPNLRGAVPVFPGLPRANLRGAPPAFPGFPMQARQQVSPPVPRQRPAGLFGGLFGGGGAPLGISVFGGQSSGGALFGGGGQVTRAPMAGNPMVVDPSTRAGSTLESMGFSSGAVIPQATVENLSKRGYI